jgi:hypothetical protein
MAMAMTTALTTTMMRTVGQAHHNRLNRADRAGIADVVCCCPRQFLATNAIFLIQCSRGLRWCSRERTERWVFFELCLSLSLSLSLSLAHTHTHTQTHTHTHTSTHTHPHTHTATHTHVHVHTHTRTSVITHTCTHTHTHTHSLSRLGNDTRRRLSRL